MAVDGTLLAILRSDPLTLPPGERQDLPPTRRLEERIGYSFVDPALLQQALTHAGAGHGRRGIVHNERLEFLGDRVLGLIVAEWLFEQFPTSREGELGPRHAALVRRESLAEAALAIDLNRHMILAPADAAGGAAENPKLLADACEALIGALYLDGGLEPARRFIRAEWTTMLGRVTSKPLEPKTALQEWAQGHGRPLPRYRVIESRGTAHAPSFQVSVEVEGLPPATAAGSSKRAAEKAAAARLLEELGVRGQKAT